IALKRIIGNAEELERIRITVNRRGVAAGETQLCCRVDRESEIGDVGPVVKRAVGNAVAGVKAGELAEIVETVKRTTERNVVMQAAEIPSVEGILNLRKRGRTATRGDAHDAGHGVRPIENAVGAAKHFNFFDTRGRNQSEVHGAANFVERYAIEHNLAGVAITTTDE